MFTCPKHMEFGPCGGVESDGSCEVATDPCVFLETPTVRWREAVPGASDPAEVPASAGATRIRALMDRRPVVIADLPARALDAASIEECAAILQGHVDAVLAGDSGSDRVQFPPAYRASLLQAAGLEVWAGLNCRDRNRVAIEGELAALAHAQVAGVHCVTGDHTLTGDRPDARPVFDLDSTRVAALARASGHLVSVAESPLAPPGGRRAERLGEKQRAGAELCFVDHAGGVEPVRRFIAEARDLGVTLRFVPCIPIVLDRASAELLLTFTALVLPEGYLDGILSTADPRRAGVAAAIELGCRLRELDGVVGVNLSGGTSTGNESAFADGLAEIGEALLS